MSIWLCKGKYVQQVENMTTFFYCNDIRSIKMAYYKEIKTTVSKTLMYIRLKRPIQGKYVNVNLHG